MPGERLDAFLGAVAAALRPGGTLGIIDSRREPRSTSADQPPPPSGTSGTTGGVAVPSSVGGTALQADPVAMLGRPLHLGGNLGSAAAGSTLDVQRWDPKTANWVTTATTTAGSDGSYKAAWQTDHIGDFQLRVVPAGSTASARAADAAPSVMVTVYRPTYATWYGSGFYGKKTACGQRLRPGGDLPGRQGGHR